MNDDDRQAALRAAAYLQVEVVASPEVQKKLDEIAALILALVVEIEVFERRFDAESPRMKD